MRKLWNKVYVWQIESAVVLLILLTQLFFVEVSLKEVVGSLAVWITFMHGQVSDRMQEKMAEQAEPDVECYRWSNRYFMAKEVLWILYFFMTGAYAAITGAAVFFLYPLWRKIYRKRIEPWRKRT